MTSRDAPTVVDADLLVEVSESGPPDEEWLQALDLFGCDEPSQTPGYFDALRNLQRDTGNTPVVCVARRKGRICGLSIAIRGYSDIEFRLGERRVFSTPVRSLTVTGVRPLFSDEAAGSAVARRLSDLGDDLLIVERYNPTADFWEGLTKRKILRRRGRAYLPEGCAESCSLQVRGTWAAYQKGLPGKVRHELNRKQNRINQAFGETAVTLERFETLDQTARFYDAMRSVEDSTWQHRRVRGRAMDYARGRQYLDRLAHHGLLLGYLLCVNGRPIAFAFGIRYKTRFHIKEIGFTMEHKAYSPGQVLLYRVVNDVFERNDITECDLGYGKARFKKEICDRFSPVAILWLPRNTPVMACVITLHTLWMRTHGLAGRTLARMGAYQAVSSRLRHS